jgi:ABC-2 type transport system permease protein
MRKVLTIGWREYRATVATKAFVIGLALMPILFGGGAVLQALLQDRVDVDDKRIVVVDHTGELFAPLVAAAEGRDEAAGAAAEAGAAPRQPKFLLEQLPAGQFNDEKRLELSDKVKSGELYAFVELPQGLLELPEGGGLARPKFYSLNRVVSEPREWLQQQVSAVVREHRFAQSQLDPAIVQQVMSPVDFDTLEPFDRSATGEIQEAKEQNRGEAFLVPLAVMMLMTMAIFTTSQGLVQSVLEEKQLRIAEVLLGSANAGHLMLGKLLGNIGASVTMVLTYLVGGALLAAYYDKLEYFSPQILTWFFIFQVLAVMLYGALFLAVGAACSNVAETQSLLLPVILLAMFPMFVWFIVLQEPLGTFSLGISLIPTATPMLMVMRMAAAPSMPIWQPILGLVLVLLTTCFFVFVAGRVFRIGILSRGKAPSVRELVRWVATG